MTRRTLLAITVALFAVWAAVLAAGVFGLLTASP